MKIEIQEGLLFQRLEKMGCLLTVKDGYHFYDTRRKDNYDEDGNLRSDEEISWCEKMYCLCETAEQVNEYIVSAKVEEINNGS